MQPRIGIGCILFLNVSTWCNLKICFIGPTDDAFKRVSEGGIHWGMPAGGMAGGNTRAGGGGGKGIRRSEVGLSRFVLLRPAEMALPRPAGGVREGICRSANGRPVKNHSK